MCRFLILQLKTPAAVQDMVQQFARMCQHSAENRSGWQGDGWGVAWWQDQDGWHRYRSIMPIWTEPQVLERLPPVRHLMVHARSASFARHQGEVAYNQPYLAGPYAFVFNGMLKGVRLPTVPGGIGAEKIWRLVQEQLSHGVPLQQALAQVYTILDRHSREIHACNMGLSNGQEYAWYNGNPQGQAYYQLHCTHQENLRMVSSEPFGPWSWRVSKSASPAA